MNFRNHVQLVGNLGKAPELKTLESGNLLAKASLAVSTQYLNGQGQPVENTTWLTISAWGKIAERMGATCDKGTKLVIFGKLDSGSYQAKDGTKKYFTEVVVNDFLVMHKPIAKSEVEESPLENTTENTAESPAA